MLISAYSNLIKDPSNNQMGMGGWDSLPLSWKEKEATRARQRSGSQPHLFPHPTPPHPPSISPSWARVPTPGLGRSLKDTRVTRKHVYVKFLMGCGL